MTSNEKPSELSKICVCEFEMKFAAKDGAETDETRIRVVGRSKWERVSLSVDD